MPKNLQRHSLEIILFITGFVVMALEISGSRIVAPFLGASTFVWTSLIGVVLASLSVGYWFGGRLADKRPDFETFSLLILAAAISTAVSAVLEFPALLLIDRLNLNLRVASVLSALVLYAIPSLFLGMITPFGIRLSMLDIVSSGQVAGRLYAISTAGSIMGTFLAGFYLLSLLGSRELILCLALLLCFAAILAQPKFQIKAKLSVLFLTIGLIWLAHNLREIMANEGIIDLDTDYQRTFIIDSKNSPSNRPLRMLVTDPFGIQSKMYLDNPDEMVSEYLNYYRLLQYFNPKIKRLLMLGGGAYTVPKFLLNNFPEMEIDVVEIDPEITEIAKKYFMLKENPRLRIFHEDARIFINRASDTYDAILVDVANSAPSIPFQLATKEVATKISQLMTKDAVVMVNIISALDGDAGRLFKAEAATYAAVFPSVTAYAILNPEEKAQPQNIIIVAQNKKFTLLREHLPEELRKFFDRRVKAELNFNVPILTDNFAPVDFYAASVLNALQAGKYFKPAITN